MGGLFSDCARILFWRYVVKSDLLHRPDFCMFDMFGFAFRGTRKTRGEPNSPLGLSGLSLPLCWSKGASTPLEIPRGWEVLRKIEKVGAHLCAPV